MLLDGGSYKGARILSPLTVAKMTTPASAAGDPNVRGLGWDIDSVVLVEPRRAAAARVVRPHRLHRHVALDRSGDEGVRRVPVEPRPSGRQGRRDAAARARRDGRRVGDHRRPAGGRARAPDDRARLRRDRRRAGARRRGRRSRPGIDVLRAQGFAPLKGKRVGLVTNHTGRARDGATTIDLLFAAKDVKLVALFSPEHGIRGIARRHRAGRSGREDRAADQLALRRHAPPDRRDARRARRHRDRSAGHRLALLHLHDDDGVRDGGGGARSSCRVRARSPESDRTAGRSKDRRSTRTRRASSATFRRCRSATA